jgi:hypothetical protein
MMLTKDEYYNLSIEQKCGLFQVEKELDYHLILIEYVIDWTLGDFGYQAYKNWYMSTQTPLGKALA